MSLIPGDTSSSLPSPLNDQVGSGEAQATEQALRSGLVVFLIAVGGLITGSFVYSQIAGHESSFLIISICLAIVMTWVAYYRFSAVLLIFAASIWINFGGGLDLAKGISSGSGKSLYPVEFGALFLLLIWLLRSIGLKRASFVHTSLDTPLIAYFAFSLFTAINGALFWDPAVLQFYASQPDQGRTAIPVVVIEMLTRVLAIGMFWVFANNLTDQKWLKRVSCALLLPGVYICLSVYHLVPAIASGWPELVEIVTGATLWAWLLDGQSSRPTLRFFASIALILIVFQVFFLNIRWISGWIGLFTALYYVSWLKSKRLFFILACIGIVLALGSQPFLKSAVVNKVQTSGDMDRFSMARASLLYGLKFPLGVGVGNYRAYNGYYGSRGVWNTTPYTSAHDTYAQALSEMGILGLTLTVVWVVTGLVMLTRFYYRSPPGFSRIMIMGIAGMWAGISAASTLGDYLIPVYHNGGLISMSSTIYAWIALGVAVAHARGNGSLASVNSKLEMPTPVPIMSASAFYPRRLG